MCESYICITVSLTYEFQFQVKQNCNVNGVQLDSIRYGD